LSKDRGSCRKGSQANNSQGTHWQRCVCLWGEWKFSNVEKQNKKNSQHGIYSKEQIANFRISILDSPQSLARAWAEILQVP
jgi:hypothetical protein